MITDTKYFVWIPNYSVGVDTFDEQHKHFFDLANKVLDVKSEADISHEKVRGLVKELSDYAGYHLNTEEEYFSRFGYYDAVPHIQAHDLYRKKMEEFSLRLENEKTNFKELAEEIAWYSGNWLSAHILTMDKNYQRFFTSRL